MFLLFPGVGTLIPLRNRNAFLLPQRGILLTDMRRSWYPPICEVKSFDRLAHKNHCSLSSPFLSVIATMAINSSDFEPIRERRNQVYAIKRELIVFTKLIVVNEARLRHFEEYLLRGVSDVRQ